MIERNVSTPARKDAPRQQHLRRDRAMIPEIKRYLYYSKVDLISSMAVRVLDLRTDVSL